VCSSEILIRSCKSTLPHDAGELHGSLHRFKFYSGYSWLCDVPRLDEAPRPALLCPRFRTGAGTWRGTDDGKRPPAGAGQPGASESGQRALAFRHMTSVARPLSRTLPSLLQRSIHSPASNACRDISCRNTR
jgi:hypothetical protein